MNKLICATNFSQPDTEGLRHALTVDAEKSASFLARSAIRWLLKRRTLSSRQYHGQECLDVRAVRNLKDKWMNSDRGTTAVPKH